jgi:hypothetical protein
VALNVAEYALPAVTPDNAVVATASGFFTIGVMVRDACADFVESAELMAVTVAGVLVLTAGDW